MASTEPEQSMWQELKDWCRLGAQICLISMIFLSYNKDACAAGTQAREEFFEWLSHLMHAYPEQCAVSAVVLFLYLVISRTLRFLDFIGRPFRLTIDFGDSVVLIGGYPGLEQSWSTDPCSGHPPTDAQIEVVPQSTVGLKSTQPADGVKTSPESQTSAEQSLQEHMATWKAGIRPDLGTFKKQRAGVDTTSIAPVNSDKPSQPAAPQPQHPMSSLPQPAATRVRHPFTLHPRFKAKSIRERSILLRWEKLVNERDVSESASILSIALAPPQETVLPVEVLVEDKAIQDDQPEQTGPIEAHVEDMAPSKDHEKIMAPTQVHTEDVAPIEVHAEDMVPLKVHTEDVAPMQVHTEAVAPIEVHAEDMAPTQVHTKDVAPQPLVEDSVSIAESPAVVDSSCQAVEQAITTGTTVDSAIRQSSLMSPRPKIRKQVRWIDEIESINHAEVGQAPSVAQPETEEVISVVDHDAFDVSIAPYAGCGGYIPQLDVVEASVGSQDTFGQLGPPLESSVWDSRDQQAGETHAAEVRTEPVAVEHAGLGLVISTPPVETPMLSNITELRAPEPNQPANISAAAPISPEVDMDDQSGPLEEQQVTNTAVLHLEGPSDTPAPDEAGDELVLSSQAAVDLSAEPRPGLQRTDSDTSILSSPISDIDRWLAEDMYKYDETAATADTAMLDDAEDVYDMNPPSAVDPELLCYINDMDTNEEMSYLRGDFINDEDADMTEEVADNQPTAQIASSQTDAMDYTIESGHDLYMTDDYYYQIPGLGQDTSMSMDTFDSELPPLDLDPQPFGIMMPQTTATKQTYSPPPPPLRPLSQHPYFLGASIHNQPSSQRDISPDHYSSPKPISFGSSKSRPTTSLSSFSRPSSVSTPASEDTIDPSLLNLKPRAVHDAFFALRDEALPRPKFRAGAWQKNKFQPLHTEWSLGDQPNTVDTSHPISNDKGSQRADVEQQRGRSLLFVTDTRDREQTTPDLLSRSRNLMLADLQRNRARLAAAEVAKAHEDAHRRRSEAPDLPDDPQAWIRPSPPPEVDNDAPSAIAMSADAMLQQEIHTFKIKPKAHPASMAEHVHTADPDEGGNTVPLIEDTMVSEQEEVAVLSIEPPMTTEEEHAIPSTEIPLSAEEGELVAPRAGGNPNRDQSMCESPFMNTDFNASQRPHFPPPTSSRKRRRNSANVDGQDKSPVAERHRMPFKRSKRCRWSDSEFDDEEEQSLKPKPQPMPTPIPVTLTKHEKRRRDDDDGDRLAEPPVKRLLKSPASRSAHADLSTDPLPDYVSSDDADDEKEIDSQRKKGIARTNPANTMPAAPLPQERPRFGGLRLPKKS